MAVSVVHAREIGTALVTAINAGFTGSEALKFSQFGSMRYMPLPPGWLVSNVPCCFVHPTNEGFEKVTLGSSGKWEEEINFRITHVFRYGSGDDIWTDKVARAQTLAYLLMNNFLLTSAVLTNGAIMDTAMRGIEYEGDEDNLAGGADEPLTANVFLYRVRVQNIRNA